MWQRPVQETVKGALGRDLTVRFSGKAVLALNRIFGSSSDAGTLARPQAGLRLGVLILPVLLLLLAKYGQATVEVLWVAVIPSWEDPDTDDGGNITPLSAGDIDQAAGRPLLIPFGVSGSLEP